MITPPVLILKCSVLAIILAIIPAATTLQAGVSPAMDGSPAVGVVLDHVALTTRVSVSSTGEGGNRDSFSFNAGTPSLSANGRYVAFVSQAANLVPDDTNNAADIFVHDCWSGETVRASVSSSGGQGDQPCCDPCISPDGRFVVFTTLGSLVPEDLNDYTDVYLRDFLVGKTFLVSVSTDGCRGHGHSNDATMSSNGRYVVFASAADNLVPDDTNGCIDVFVHDREMGRTSRVSLASDGVQGNGDSTYPYQSDPAGISADGRFVVFASLADNLVPDDTNGVGDIFVHDRKTGRTRRVSLSSDGDQATHQCVRPVISANGRTVAFFTQSGNLVPGDTNNENDVFVHDLSTGETTRVSLTSTGAQCDRGSYYPSISGDGRYVAFRSLACDLVSGDTNNQMDIFIRDRDQGETRRISVSSLGEQANSASECPFISADGRSVAFYSWANNLVLNDTNDVIDAFRHKWAKSPAAGVVAGPGPGIDNPPMVGVFSPCKDGSYITRFSAYGTPHFGVNVSCGDLDGDGSDEILTGAGPDESYGPHVRGFHMDGKPLPGIDFLAYSKLTYGVNVAAGDLDGDGSDEIITGAGPGPQCGPHVRAFYYDWRHGAVPVPVVSFRAYGTHRWGVEVAAGDIDGDGYDEIVTGAGPGAVYGRHVRGWDVDGKTATPISEVSFLAYKNHHYGVNVTCGDVDGDGIAEIITGPGPYSGLGAGIRGWNYNGSSVSPIPGLCFFAWSPSQVRYGAKVFAGIDFDGDSRDELVVGCGPDPKASGMVRIYSYDGTEVTQLFSEEVFPDITHGVNVAAGVF